MPDQRWGIPTKSVIWANLVSLNKKEKIFDLEWQEANLKWPDLGPNGAIINYTSIGSPAVIEDTKLRDNF